MFDIFQLHSGKQGLMGYSWELKNPKLVVCLIHGLGEHAGRFDKVGEAFKKNEIAMLGLDLRGHGGTIGKRGHIGPRELVNKDVSSLISYAKEKYPNCPVALYGHSMGGNIVLHYRLRGELSDQIKAYISSSPWLELYVKVPEPVYKVVKLVARIKPEFQISSNIATKTIREKANLNREKNRAFNHGSISAETALECFEIGNFLLDNKIPSRNGGEKKPLILFHGDKDKICEVEGSRKYNDLQKKLGNPCTYIEWEGYPHELHNGNGIDDGTKVIEKIIELLEPFKL